MKLLVIILCVLLSIGCATERSNDKTSPCDTFKTNSKLFNDISSGNEARFLEAIDLRQCLDGGELEDYYRAVGLFFDKKPKKFIMLTKKASISQFHLEKMVTMLPLSTTDNAPSKLKIYKRRQEMITTYCLPSNESCNSLIEALQKRVTFWSNILKSEGPE